MSPGRFVVPGSPDFKALVLNNQACALCRSGEFTEAIPLFLKALDIWESAFGRISEAVATCRECLGSACAAIGDYDAAIVHLREAVEIMTALPNVDRREYEVYRGILERLETGDRSILKAASEGARRMWIK